MKLVRYKPNLGGLKALRSSRGVDEDLERRAHRVAAAAEAAYAASEDAVVVDVLQEGSDTDAPRARVAVIARTPKALRIEAKRRPLGGSLDAARG